MIGIGIQCPWRPPIAGPKGAAISFDFSTMSSLPSSITFTRSGTGATAFNDSGVLTSFGANVARLGRGIPSGGRGLIVEGTRTNWLVNSVLAGGSWPPTGWPNLVTSGTTEDADSDLGSDSRAWALSATAQRCVLSQNYTTSNSTSYVLSLYVESVTGAVQIQELMLATSLPSGCSIVGYYQNGVAVASSSVVTVGRISMVIGGTYTGAATVFRIGLGVGAVTTGAVTISRPQLEAATLPSAYIPTTTTSLSRAADLPVVTLDAALATALSTQGTMVVEFEYLGGDSSLGSSARAVASIDDQTGNERVLIFNPSSNPGVVVTDGGTGQGTTSVVGTVTVNTATKVAATWSASGANGCGFVKNGGAVARDSGGATMPTVTRLGIGIQSDGSFPCYGVIKRLHIYTNHYPQAQDAAFAALTA